MEERSKGWMNPVAKHRADPWIMKHKDGYYYFSWTVPSYDHIEIARAKTLEDLGKADCKTIWREHDSGPMKHHIWAPEIHFIDGKWYIYFAAADSEDPWKIRMYALECDSANPLEGEWKEKGQIKSDWESFSLDATSFENDGKRYLIWAQASQDYEANSCLYIAEMENPWTLKSPQVQLTKPELPWECIGFKVNEGPAVIMSDHKIYLTYSASKTDFNYCMGLLSMDRDKDPLIASHWNKSRTPVFISDEEASQYGPGHNCFIHEEDSKEAIMVYHARTYKEIEGDPLHDPNRHAIAQYVYVDDEGLVLGKPVKNGWYDSSSMNK